MNLGAYRLGFAPTLAAIFVIAFSVQGVPEPLEPSPDTIQFDAELARANAGALLRAGPTRTPGSTGAAAAADYVRGELEEVASGSVAEQDFEASVDGEDVDLRNVLLTLPGNSDRAVVVVAERNSRTGSGAYTSAAATGVLLELATELGVSGRSRTLILASIDGASAAEEGLREMLAALPERTEVEAVLAVSQPGVERLEPPHLVASGADANRPSLELVRTAESALEDRAQLDARVDGALAQIARLAVPAAAGVQATLLEEGINAVTLSGAGEVPPPDAGTVDDRPAVESLERIGGATLALASAIDVHPGPLASGPEAYIRLGDNVIPAWAIALLALVLLIPPALPIAVELARARGRGARLGGAVSWVTEWVIAALSALVALYALALAGLIPRPSVPFDPGRFAIGPLELVAMVVLAGVGTGAWWILGVRRIPARPSPATLGAIAGTAVILATGLVWLANPFLALLIVPLAHVVVVHAISGRRTRALALPAALLALLPLAAAVIYVGGVLDWGATMPWQLVLLVAGGSFGPFTAVCLMAALAALAAVVRTALSPGVPDPDSA